MTGFQVSTPKLNFDVLAGIFAHVEQKRDVSSFMKTCKTLYRPAIPHILRDTVTIRGIPEVTSFGEFMLADHWSKDRNHYLSHLRILIDIDYLEDLGRLPFALAKTIKNAIHLRKLQLRSPDLLWNVRGANMFEVLQDLNSHPKLEKLAFEDVREDTVQLIGSMVPSSIVNLSLSYDFLMESPDPSPALRSLRSTITTLHMETIDPRCFTVRCPLLHTLSLETHYSVSIPVLVRAFTNLRHLSVINETESYDEDEILDLRLSNQVGIGQPLGSWSHPVTSVGIRISYISWDCHARFTSFMLTSSPSLFSPEFCNWSMILHPKWWAFI